VVNRTGKGYFFFTDCFRSRLERFFFVLTLFFSGGKIALQYGEDDTMQIRSGLTGNQLKIIAMIAMTCDHVGMMLFPQWLFLRVIGRLAMPVYAYMIAEGCRYTRNRKHYLLRLAGLAAVCQVVYFVAMGSLYQCILVTFSLSVCLIWAIEYAVQDGRLPAKLLALAVLGVSIFLCEGLTRLVPGFDIDYGIFGVLLPVMIYFGRPREKFLFTGLILLSFVYGSIQWFALAAVPLLMCYNGQRGKRSLGWLFYLFYPLHLVVIHGLSLIL
jgi:hypothetical protein